MTTQQQQQAQAELQDQFEYRNYDSLDLDEYMETSQGEFILVSKPNLYQSIGYRSWIFIRIADENGEPIMDSTDDEVVKVNA